MSDGGAIQVVGCSVNAAPASKLAMRGWIELNDNGLGDGELIATDQATYVAYAPNGRDMVPAGVLVFKIGSSTVWVSMAYVLPEYRGRGVFSAMWAALHELVFEKLPTVSSIQYEAHLNNKAMRAVAQRMGHRETAVVMKVDIPR